MRREKLTYARDVVLGLMLAFVMWLVLAWTQAAWGDATNDPSQSEYLAALGLVAAGAILVGIISWRRVSDLSLAVAATAWLVLLGPLVLQLGSWGPDWLRESALQVGTSSGTYLALGVLLAGAVVSLRARWSSSSGRSGRYRRGHHEDPTESTAPTSVEAGRV